MTRFKINQSYMFSYDQYSQEMKQHGGQPDTNCKAFNGQLFTMQDTTDYVVLRHKHQWIAINPIMCKEVR